MDELIPILIEFGGGKGGQPGNNAVRFLLAAFFWAVLAVIAGREWRRGNDRCDLCISLAALLGICRELLMFTAEYGSSRGLVSFDFMYGYYPPLEHAATMLSCIAIAYAFMRQVLAGRRFAAWFLGISTSATLLIYIVTAFDWQGFLAARPGVSFGLYGGDMAFRIAASTIMATALATFVRARKMGRLVPTLLIAGFTLLFLDEFLMIFSLATRERHVAVLAPIRHNLHIWAIPFLVGTYWSELRRRLNEAKQFSSDVIDSLSARICVLDAAGTIIAVNRSWREADPAKTLLGYRLSEGTNYLHLCESTTDRQDEQVSAMADGIRSVMNGTRREFALEYATNGPDDTRWNMARVTRFSDSGPVRVVIAQEDITGRKRAEKALADSEQRYRTLVDNLPLGITLVDNQHRIVMVNQTEAAWFQRPQESFNGQLCFEQFEQRDNTCPHCPGVIAMQSGGIAQSDTEGIRSDGSRFSARIRAVPLFDNGSAVGFIEVVEDITERLKADEALRESEERYRQIYEAMGQGMALLELIPPEEGRPADCRFLEVNPSYEKIVGLSKEQTVGHTLREIFPGLEEYWFETYARVAMTGEATTYENYARPLDRYYQVYAYSPKIGQFAVLVNDITEQRRIEEERHRLEAQMQHAQKLESLGVLAGGIAHDFNNILLAILGHAELALMRLNPTSPARDNLLKIEQAAQRAAELSRQMLAYSGKGKFIVESIDIGELVTEMTHMLEVSISKKAILRFNLAADLPPVEADATQLRQVLMNLVINASEAIGDKSGVIAISTGAMQCDRHYLAQTWINEQLEEGLYVYVEVADTGCGMDRETLARIFDPFFTTKFTGRGLGMAAVLGIVRGHNGAIKTYSEPGRGTTFKLLLPASAERAHELRRTMAVEDLWHGSGTILLVDDEETIRVLGSEMLEALGFKVLTADNGRHALEVYREQQDEIDGVILDLTMPHMDGEEAFRELRRIRADIRVIMSSGYNEQEVSQRFLGKRLAGFIQKPYKIAELSAVLRQALET